MCKRFGEFSGIPNVPEQPWTEWVMDAGAMKNNVLTAEQGMFWYFDLHPNRHFRLDKKVWIVERDGEFVSTDSVEVRRKREEFFAALLNSIGFPLETLHVYDREERERRYTFSGDGAHGYIADSGK